MPRKGGAGVIVTGDKEIDRMLRDFEPKVQKTITRKATREGAKYVLEAARIRAPLQTGELEMSLKVRAMKRRKGTRRGTKIGHSVVTGEGFFIGDQFYGGFLEFGTKDRKHTSGKSVGRIEPGAFDFLRPALYENKAVIKRLFLTAMKTAISEAAKKRGRR